MDICREHLVKMAQMYYEENLTQQEIAKYYGISRSNVSKMLTRCRELGIVEITINTLGTKSLSLQDKIEKLFDLKQVVVVPSQLNRDDTTVKVATAGAKLLADRITDSTKIGITRGITLCRMVQQFNPIRSTAMNEVTQLVGGYGQIGIDGEGFDVPLVLAKKLEAPCNILQSPPIVQSAELRKMLCNEKTVSNVLKKAENVDIAVMGIGGISLEDNSYYRVGLLTKEEMNTVINEGVVGEICGKLIDINGDYNFSINDRLIGLELEKLKLVGEKIAILAGRGKAKGLYGAIKGNFVDTIVIDEELALQLLKVYNIQTKAGVHFERSSI